MIKLLKIIGIAFIAVGLCIAMVGIIIFNSNLPTQRVYDCGMAEWHPDIPPQVKEECRRLGSAKII